MSNERLIAGRPGLQAERTDLAWARTALAFVVNGGLLLVHYSRMNATGLALIGGAVALALALFTLFMSRRRQHVLTRRPLPERLTDPLANWLLAGGAIALGIITLIELLVT